MKIYAQKNGTYTKQELLELATLLIKGGYTVRRGKVKINEKPTEVVEFFGDFLGGQTAATEAEGAEAEK